MSEITKALIQFHKDVGVIEKNAKAQYGKFSDLCGVLSTVTPALLKNDLVITQEFLEDSLVTTLRHTSGETISSTSKLVVTPGRNELHSWGASVTYTRRYQICSILGIVADMDMDGAMLEESTKPAQVAKPDLAKPAPKKTVTKKAAPAPTPAPAPTAAPDPADQPLMKEEVDAILELLIEKRKDNVSEFEKIQKQFMEHFKISADCRFSESITTQAHLKFINALF